MAATPVPQLTWEQALAWRLERQRLVPRAGPSELLRVTSDLGGLHAQLMSSAELTLWARIEGLELGALQEALWERRELVKLWSVRGTLYLLPTAELGLWLGALGTITDRGMTGHPKIDQLTEAVGGALARRVLTREALAAEVERRTGSDEIASWVRSSWGSYLKPASFRGRLCFAPSDDGRARFTSPAHWLGARVDVQEPAEALRELSRRFFAAYAPATGEDLGLWSGFGPAKGRRMLAALGDEVVEVDVEGERAWVPAEDLDELASAETQNAARLLPAFDAWVVGAARFSPAQLDPKQRERIYRPQGWISPVVLVNGRMAGVWRHKRRARTVEVEIVPFGRLPAWARAELALEAERLASFLGGALALRL